MTPVLEQDDKSESTDKARAIKALVACGFHEIGVDGSGLRLLKSASGTLLIGVGSCRSLAYSPTGPGGHLQLVATSRTPALLRRIASRDIDLSDYFPLRSAVYLCASSASDRALASAPTRSARRYAFGTGSRAQWVVDSDAIDEPNQPQHQRDAKAPERERAFAYSGNGRCLSVLSRS